MDKKLLQKNAAFRKKLANLDIGWRDFIAYGWISESPEYRGIGETHETLYSVGMGKWNGIYDYDICHVWENGEVI